MNNTFQLIGKIRKLQNRKSKISLLLLIIFTFIVSFIETIGISTVMFFITLVINPSKIESNKYLFGIKFFFGITTINRFILFLGIILIFIYFVRLVLLILHSYYLQKYSLDQFRILALRLYKKYMEMPYQDFTKRSSSELTKMIISEANSFSVFIQNLTFLATEILTLSFVYIVLLFIKWEATLILTFFGLIFTLIIVKKLAQIIDKLGKSRFYSQERMFKKIFESFSNFKALKFIPNIEKETAILDKTFIEYSNSYVFAGTLNQLPKNIFEFFGFTAIVLLIFYVIKIYHNYAMVLSLISIYVIALYKILPSLHRSITYFNQSVFYYKSLDSILNDLQANFVEEGNEKIIFRKTIQLTEVQFYYHLNKIIFKNVNLTINKGERIGFLGESGMGKTTLVDIISGLFMPTGGQIFIDKQQLSRANSKNWRSIIGYIPQNIYLFEGTVAENITFGENYNKKRIEDVLEQANIYNFLKEKDGLNTWVGENGIQLSGGQKQRIGIARALYKNPDILIMDEATSALDKKTEFLVIEEIFKNCKDKTIIIIAHSKAAIENCDRLFIIDKGKVIEKK